MASESAVSLKKLTVGYGGQAIVRDIDVDFVRGKMICILGSNGAGKTTMLKTIARIIAGLDGKVAILGEELTGIRSSALAKEMAVVLTSKIDIENLTGFEVASMGRYPHTGFFCKLTGQDVAVVEKYLELCSASYLRDKYFHEMSDGEKQKIMLVRGLAQEAEILMLDEPTSHLDIRHKLELLHLLRRLCIEEHRTIICTLHEPDLAVKCCDYLVLVKEDRILANDTTERVIESGLLDQLYGFSQHQFNPWLGLVEFPNPQEKDVYLIGSDSKLPSLLRSLNKFGVGFGLGVLQQNDVAYHIAMTMGAPVEVAPAYMAVSETNREQAYRHALDYRRVLVCDFPACSLTEQNFRLAKLLEEQGKSVIRLNDGNRQEELERICAEKAGNIR